MQVNTITFNAGDRVRVTQLIEGNLFDRDSGIKVGDIHRVVAVHHLDTGYVGIDFKPYANINGIDCYPMRDYQLELVKEDKMQNKEKDVRKFKVGDKVRIINGWYPYGSPECRDNTDVGKKGIVTELQYSKEWIRVAVIDGEEWFYDSDSIELVKKDKPKTELRIVYKVMSLPALSVDKFKSWSGRDDITIVYEIDKKTKTPKGWNPLFAFDTIENARSASTPLNPVLKCVAKVRVDDQDFSFMGGTPPTGTVLCDWVFPVEAVK